MLLRVVAICSLAVFGRVQSSGFKKCCPEGEIVHVDSFEDNDLSPQKHFSCQKQSVSRMKSKSKRESDNYEVDSVTVLSQMIAFNVLVDSDQHWPSCSESSFISSTILSQSLKASVSASCVDILNGHYHLFTCNERLDSSNDFKDIYNLRKCCENDFSFDIFARTCVAKNNSIGSGRELFKFLGDKSVTFESGIPNCKTDDVLVEYHSLVHKLKIYETSLIITATDKHGPDVLKHGSYCIENTIRSDDLPDNVDHRKAASKFIAKTCRPKSICNEMPCVRKCCKEGLRMVIQNETTFCELHDKHLHIKFHRFDMHASPEEPEKMEPTEYGILMPKHCDKFMLDREQEIHFFSGLDGSLFLPENEDFHSNDGYCVEYFNDRDDTEAAVGVIEQETFVCFDEVEINNTRRKYQIYASLLAVSAVFLAATFFVYVFLPQLLNLHGKTLVCHVLSLFIAYSFLSAVQFGSHSVNETFCKIVAYILLCSFLAAFSWLNVMCLDIYWTICSFRRSHGIRKNKETKRFICYSIYAFGFPCLMSTFTYISDTYNFLPQKFKPNIGQKACWFENSSRGHIIFFLVPVGLQIFVNLVLFIITAVHCNRVKSEIHRMRMNDNIEQKRKRYLAERQTFLMNLKLFIVMGISWLLEILATFFDSNPTWWVVSDGFNLLQGVLIFFIFVFKQTVFAAFQKKLGIRFMGFRNKTPGSTSTNMSTLDLQSTGNSKYNNSMLKSSSSSTLTNSNVIKN